MVYHFQLSNRRTYSISADRFRTVQKNWAEVIERGGWSVQYLSNHDSARQVSCYGCDSDEYRSSSAKLLAALIHTTPGTPFIYQGEEIGMVNVKYDTIKDYNCCYTLGDYNAMIASGISPEDAIEALAPRSRDNARTPYQWNSEINAGFTTGKPWIKVNPKYTEINLENDLRSDDSIFAFYRELTKLRRENPAVIDGGLRFLADDDPNVIAYVRECDEQTLLVIANYSKNAVIFSLPEEAPRGKWKRILSNKNGTSPSLEEARELLPYEVEIYELER